MSRSDLLWGNHLKNQAFFKFSSKSSFRLSVVNHTHTHTYRTNLPLCTEADIVCPASVEGCAGARRARPAKSIQKLSVPLVYYQCAAFHDWQGGNVGSGRTTSTMSFDKAEIDVLSNCTWNPWLLLIKLQRAARASKLYSFLLPHLVTPTYTSEQSKTSEDNSVKFHHERSMDRCASPAWAG